MTTKTQMLFAQLVLATTVLGCATKPTVSPFTASENSLEGLELIAQASRQPNSSVRLFDPGEIIRIKGRDKGRYLCRDSRPMVCDRIGSTAYCTCPGSWARR